MNADELKAARAALGYTQPDMAASLGLSRPTLARYEGGAKIPDEIAAKVVALAGGADPVQPKAAPAVKVKAAPVEDGAMPPPDGPELIIDRYLATPPEYRVTRWRRVPGRHHGYPDLVHPDIPHPVADAPPSWAGWRGVLTKSGRVYDAIAGHQMTDPSSAFVSRNRANPKQKDKAKPGRPNA